MKKILLILFFIFISSCNFYNFLGINLLIKEKPKNIFIGESNDGAVIFEDKVQKISNLNLTNDITYLKDLEYKNLENLYPGERSSIKLKLRSKGINYYNIDKNNNGFFIFDEQEISFCRSTRIFDIASYLECSYHIFDVLDNKISKYENINLMNNDIINTTNSEENYYFKDKTDIHFYSVLYNIIDKNKSLSNIFDYVNKKLIEAYKFEDLKIGENGKGWLSLKENNYIKYFKIEDFNKSTEFLKDIFSVNNSLGNYIDTNGDGFILDIKNNLDNIVEFYLYKISNFELLKEKNLLFSSKDLENKKEVKNYFINDKGDGIVFFYKNLNNNKFEYTYMKKLVNFKLDIKEIKIVNSKNYKYYNYSINKNGNGIVILTDGENFIFKKIRNYEIEI